MDKSAIEPRLPDPTPWTHVTSAVAAWFVKRLIGRPKVGAVTITFPNGRTVTYGKPGTGFHPSLVVRNFSMVPETLKRGTIGFAHAYMRGDVEVGVLRRGVQQRRSVEFNLVVVTGHQVGEGSGKQIARIGGAVLGGFAGNEAERRYRTISHYQITVRLDDGTRRVIEQQSAPAWHEGDAVRIRNGEIVPRQAQGSGSQQPANF